MFKDQAFQRILIAIDMNDEGRAAFYAGINLATKLKAEAYVLYVSEPIRSFDFGKKNFTETTETIERVEAGVKRRVDELWQEGGLDAVDRRRVYVIVRGGKAHAEIVETARSKNIDLIVLGHGGSTTERVLRQAPCSVLAVRAPAK